MPRSPRDSATASITAAALGWLRNGTVKPKWNRDEFAHRGVAAGNIRMDCVRSLHIGEGRDDDAPDSLDRIEGQQAAMAFGKRPHHRGFATRPKGRAGIARFLDGDQRVDDPAALHQQAVHGLVDAVDLLPQSGQGRGRRGGGCLVGHGRRS